MLKMTRGVNALVKDAEATVTTLTPAEVQDRL
jgi:hypothetical protein